MKTSKARNALGKVRRGLAARRLTESGMTVLQRNWRSGRAGEIDIVARDGDALVVCEVKTRRTGAFEHPMAAVTPVKAQRLRGLAERWLQEHGGAPPAASASTSSASCCPTAAPPSWSTCGGWPDGIRAYVLGGARRCGGRRRRGPGRPGARGRGVHPGRPARQEPDGEQGPGAGGRGQLRRRVAAEEAHGGPQPGLGAQERQRIRSGYRLCRSGGLRAHRPPGARRHRDDRRAGPGRAGPAGAGCAAGRAGRGGRGIRAGGGAGMRGRRGLAGARGVRARRPQPAATDRRPHGRTGARGGARRAGPPGSAARGPAHAGDGRGHGHARHGRHAARPRTRPRRRRRPALGADRGGGRRGRRTPPVPGGPAGGGQDDARRAAARHPAAAQPRRVPGGHGRPLGRGPAAPGQTAGGRRAVLRAAPLGDHAGARRWRPGNRTAGRGVARPPGGALPRRDARVQQPCPRRPAPAPGIGACGDRAQRGGGALARPVPDGARGEPLPVRPFLAAGQPVRMPVLRDPPLPGTALGAAARPGRSEGRGGPRHPIRTHGAGRAGRIHRDGRRPGARGQGAGRGAADGTPWRTNSEVPGRELRSRGTPRREPWTTPSAAWSAACSPRAGSTVSCGSPGPSRTSWGTTGPTRRTWPWPCSCAPGSLGGCRWRSGRCHERGPQGQGG